MGENVPVISLFDQGGDGSDDFFSSLSSSSESVPAFGRPSGLNFASPAPPQPVVQQIAVEQVAIFSVDNSEPFDLGVPLPSTSSTSSSGQTAENPSLSLSSPSSEESISAGITPPVIENGRLSENSPPEQTQIEQVHSSESFPTGQTEIAASSQPSPRKTDSIIAETAPAVETSMIPETPDINTGHPAEPTSLKTSTSLSTADLSASLPLSGSAPTSAPTTPRLGAASGETTPRFSGSQEASKPAEPASPISAPSGFTPSHSRSNSETSPSKNELSVSQLGPSLNSSVIKTSDDYIPYFSSSDDGSDFFSSLGSQTLPAPALQTSASLPAVSTPQKTSTPAELTRAASNPGVTSPPRSLFEGEDGSSDFFSTLSAPAQPHQPLSAPTQQTSATYADTQQHGHHVRHHSLQQAQVTPNLTGSSLNASQPLPTVLQPPDTRQTMPFVPPQMPAQTTRQPLQTPFQPQQSLHHNVPPLHNHTSPLHHATPLHQNVAPLFPQKSVPFVPPAASGRSAPNVYVSTTQNVPSLQPVAVPLGQNYNHGSVAPLQFGGQQAGSVSAVQRPSVPSVPATTIPQNVNLFNPTAAQTSNPYLKHTAQPQRTGLGTSQDNKPNVFVPFVPQTIPTNLSASQENRQNVPFVPSHTQQPALFVPSQPQNALQHNTIDFSAQRPQTSSPLKSSLGFSSPSSGTNGMRGTHPLVTFGFGGKLITMFPRKRMRLNVLGSGGPASAENLVAGPVSVSALAKVLVNSEPYKQLSTFPGPLSSSSSADKVNQWMTERIAAEGFGEESSDSRMVWELLKILVQNHGSLTSTENANGISALREVLLRKDPRSNTEEVSPLLAQDGVAQPHTILELQKLIIAGKVEEAYRFAIAYQLWTHALILASNLNPESFRNAIQMFSESGLVEGSPLRTLYLLFAGKPKELFHAGQGVQQGGHTHHSTSGILSNWKENLSAVLANRGSNDSQKVIIGEMGDKLWSRQHRAQAAHFCYMIVGHEFDYVDNKNARLVLLGADHKLKPHSLGFIEAIQRTEIVEFSRCLANPQHSMSQILPYKLLYAQQLADFGLLDLSKKYMQAITTAVNKNRAQYPYGPIFLNQLDQFTERLSFTPASKQSSSWNIPVPTIGWNLLNKVAAFVGSDDPPSGPAAPMSGTSGQPSVPNYGVPTPSYGVPAPNYGAPIQPVQQPILAEVPKSASFTRQQQQDLKSSSDFANKSPAQEMQDDKKDKKEKRQSSPGLAKRLTGFFASALTGSSGGSSSTIRADLGEENQFEYNKELGMWLKKGTKPEDAMAAAMPPPPPTTSPAFDNRTPNLSSSMPLMGSGGPSMPTMPSAPAELAGPSAGPPGVTTAPPGFATNKYASPASGPRRRYVDTFNPDTSPVVTALPARPNQRSQTMPPMNVFTPSVFTPAPMPETAEQPQSQPENSGQADSNAEQPM
eukprot:TRINITY_DN5596_c0_g1_i1.p1 TRINITY_DN5596_c0_g1~~TRINITY_DN5596_c0_g1_i1.p1  ORF type:complete len:1432 (-),score=344.82 TRINITY_DN5596_c0_g1_i1:13-4308(-)